MADSSPQATYLKLIGEAVSRLDVAAEFLQDYADRDKLPLLDASILQVRKALELIAIAAIAPDKPAYARFRAAANKDPDYTKDYHAAKIFGALERVNPNFFPKPLGTPEQQVDGSWHFPDKRGALTKKQFERNYDRLGAHLHAQNPWGNERHIGQLTKALPGLIFAAKDLIALHARFIQTPDFRGVWVVQATSPEPTFLTATAAGPYAVVDA